eukprot:7406920-Pyramimonas_sp.AAC.1
MLMREAARRARDAVTSIQTADLSSQPSGTPKRPAQSAASRGRHGIKTALASKLILHKTIGPQHFRVAEGW